MKKLILFIIGIAIIMYVPSALAQRECDAYADKFNCGNVNDYCSLISEINADEDGGMDIYRSAYCNITRDKESELYELIAEQLAVEDPKWDDPDLIKFILEDLSQDSLNKFLEDKYGTIDPKKLPDALLDKVSTTVEIDRLLNIQSRIQLAFDQEKIMHQTKESLKAQFEMSEMWMNGKIELDGSAPFDLITDLNLIEIILFGSEAQWMDDVYSFSSDEDDDEDDDEGVDDSDTPSTPDPTDSNDSSDPTSGETIGDEEEFLCVPNSTIATLLKEADDTDPLTNQFAIGQPASLEPGQVPEGCGNRRMEGEEECDDGNLEAGDGCSISCEIESCSSLDCKDPDAVTFSQLPPAVKDAVTSKSIAEAIIERRGDADVPDCGDGATALTQAELDALSGAKDPAPIEQHPNFNPNIGGILEAFPPSKRPPCPGGETEFKITLINGDTSSTCIPTHFCTDFEAARKLIFGPDYAENPISESIEAMVCIDIKKLTRPDSPYPLSEGCIDCHILAMNDTLNEMINKNVAPLENNMQAWGLSNRWGPSVSFDLVSIVGTPKPYIKPLAGYVSPAEDATKAIEQSKQQARKGLDANRTPNLTSVLKAAEGSDIFALKSETNEKAEEKYFKNLKNYQKASGAEADRSVYASITPLLKQLLTSFDSVSGKFIGIQLSTTLHEKEECKY